MLFYCTTLYIYYYNPYRATWVFPLPHLRTHGHSALAAVLLAAQVVNLLVEALTTDTLPPLAPPPPPPPRPVPPPPPHPPTMKLAIRGSPIVASCYLGNVRYGSVETRL